MCAFTASRPEEMENFSAGGPGWQVSKEYLIGKLGEYFHHCWPEYG
jgi:hypothetical protein